jgi:hypothetical protein
MVIERVCVCEDGRSREDGRPVVREGSPMAGMGEFYYESKKGGKIKKRRGKIGQINSTHYKINDNVKTPARDH